MLHLLLIFFCWFFESYCAMQSEKLSKSVKIKFVIAHPLHHKTIIAKPLHFMLFQSWIFRLKNLRFEGGSLSSPANCQWYRNYFKVQFAEVWFQWNVQWLVSSPWDWFQGGPMSRHCLANSFDLKRLMEPQKLAASQQKRFGRNPRRVFWF